MQGRKKTKNGTKRKKTTIFDLLIFSTDQFYEITFLYCFTKDYLERTLLTILLYIVLQRNSGVPSFLNYLTLCLKSKVDLNRKFGRWAINTFFSQESVSLGLQKNKGKTK